MAHITDHAVLRYQQRVDPVADQDARAAMLACSRTIDMAACMGCDTVIMGNGARLKLQGDVVSTVLEKRHGKASRHG